MRILINPQYSMRSYKTGEWLIDNDSAANRWRYIVYELSRIKPEWEFFIIKPNSYKYKAFDFEEIPIMYGNNVATQRYNFDGNNFIAILKHYKPDIILNDIPELTANMRVYMDFYNLNIPIISLVIYSSFMVSGSKFDYTYRQLDGFMYSNKVVFFTQESKKAYKSNPLFSKVKNKFVLWDALCSRHYIENKILYSHKIEEINKEKIIFSINRLTDDLRTNANFGLAVLSKLLLKDLKDYQIFVANVNDKDVNLPFNEFHGSHTEFINLLVRTSYVPVFYKPKLFSTGLDEAKACGCQIVQILDKDVDVAANKLYSIIKNNKKVRNQYVDLADRIEYIADTIENVVIEHKKH